jgi:hypothetical protein
MMPESDIAIGSVGIPTNGTAISKKPSYLICMEETNSKKSSQKFITLDKPEFITGFVQVKGIFTNLPESEVIKNYLEVLTSAPKDLYLEVLIPWHRISYIRSLVFKQK